MNLSSYRTRIARAVGGLSTSDTDDLALIDAWVNEGVVQFLKDTKINVLSAVLGVTAGSADYTLDTDILGFTDVWYEPASGEDVMLEPVDSLEIARMRLSDGTTDSSPRYYAMQGAHLLQIHPAPASSSDQLHILYTPRPAAMSATSDAPSDSTKGNVPEEYHPVIEAYAKWKAAQADDHRPSDFGLNFQAEYERGCSQARAHMNRKAGVFKARKRLGRRRRWPTSPGVDR